ncbi:unnamed protein product, partial [Prorocentrum cordatum]
QVAVLRTVRVGLFFARFMSLYYLAEGLDEAEIGAVFAAGSLTGPFASTLVGFTADRLYQRSPAARHVCYAICVVLGTFSFSMQLVRAESLSRFHVMIVCRIAFNACNNSALVLLDAITLEALSDRKRYGEERLYGAVSWAIMHVALGILIDIAGRFVQHRLIVVMCVSLLIVLASIGLPGVPAPTSQEVSNAKKPTGLVVLADSRALGVLIAEWWSNKVVLGFFLYTIVLGYGMTIVENLIGRRLFLYFKELNASNFLCGLSVVVTVVFEIPLFSRSKQLLERYGEHALLTMAGLCYSFRVVGYTLCPGGWYVLLFEPLHGVTVALCGTASVQMMTSITPAALVATGQAFMNLLRSCFGSSLGTFVGGRSSGTTARQRATAAALSSSPAGCCSTERRSPATARRLPRSARAASAARRPPRRAGGPPGARARRARRRPRCSGGV